LSPIEIAWTVVGIIVPLLIGVGLTFAGLAPPEFKRARFCFIFAALLLGGMEIVWYTQTGFAFVWRVGIASLICLTIGIGLPETLRWVHRREIAQFPSASHEPSEAPVEGPPKAQSGAPLNPATEKREPTNNAPSPKTETPIPTPTQPFVAPEAPAPPPTVPAQQVQKLKPPTGKQESPPALRTDNQETPAERQEFLGRLTKLYILSHDNISSEMMAGFVLPPDDWLNEELTKFGKTWRMKNGQIINTLQPKE
jgi:hypothetical protein